MLLDPWRVPVRISQHLGEHYLDEWAHRPLRRDRNMGRSIPEFELTGRVRPNCDEDLCDLAKVARMGSRAGLFALLVALLAGSAASSEAHAGTLISTTVRPGDRTTAIAPHFTGLSYEYNQMFPRAGNAAVINGPFVRLLDQITQTGSGSPVLRVGAGTADASWWNPNGEPKPPYIVFDLTPSYFDSLHLLQAAAHTPLIVDLNMAANRPKLAVDMAKAANQMLGPSVIQAFEVGNEPDVYDVRKLGPHYARPKSWSFRHYLKNLHTFFNALEAVRPRPRLAGPASSGRRAWDTGLPRLLRREGRRLSFVTYHHYPLPGCYGATREDRKVSAARLLYDGKFAYAAQRLRGLVGVARRHALKVRLSETNTSPCGWRPDGLSGTFAPALWASDWMFVMSAIGISGVNFHASGAMSPIYPGYTPDGRYFVQVPPIFYGILLFSRATANHARLIPNPTFTARSRPNSRARVWVTRDRKRTTRVLVLAKSASHGGRVVINLVGARRTGSLIRLSARRGLNARNGVTLGGQSFAHPSFDGELTGPEKVEHVNPHGGRYVFKVPPASAALLTVKRP